jgi:hypothetical protein
MNRHKFAFAVMFSLVGLGGISSAAYVHSTIAHYRNAAPCYQLTGIPGLLQATHFIPSGGCTVDLKKGGCHDSRVCTLENPPSPGSSNGHCTPISNGTDCACTADKPGRP